MGNSRTNRENVFHPTPFARARMRHKHKPRLCCHLHAPGDDPQREQPPLVTEVPQGCPRLRLARSYGGPCWAETRGKRDGNIWQNSAKEPSGSDWDPEFPAGLAGRHLGNAQCSRAGEVAVPHIPLGARGAVAAGQLRCTAEVLSLHSWVNFSKHNKAHLSLKSLFPFSDIK